jgi:hypothetical protein
MVVAKYAHKSHTEASGLLSVALGVLGLELCIRLDPRKEYWLVSEPLPCRPEELDNLQNADSRSLPTLGKKSDSNTVNFCGTDFSFLVIFKLYMLG